MSKGITTPNDVLKCLLSGTNPSYSGNLTLYLALHTSDPSAGDQTTNEAVYSGYSRYALTKVGAWTDAGSTFTNAGLIQFAICSGPTSKTVTHISIGLASGLGASQILYCGALSASKIISDGIQPQFAIDSLAITES